MNTNSDLYKGKGIFGLLFAKMKSAFCSHHYISDGRAMLLERNRQLIVNNSKSGTVDSTTDITSPFHFQCTKCGKKIKR